MPTNYTSLLGLAQPTVGELDGVWGVTVNTSVTQLVEDSIATTATASVTGGDWTLSTVGSGVFNEARCAIIIPTGTPGVTRNVIAPSKSKSYIVHNQSNAPIVFKGAATTGVTVASGAKYLLVWNGTDFAKVNVDVAGTDKQVQFNNAGVMGASTKLTFNDSSGTLSSPGFLVNEGGTSQSNGSLLSCDGAANWVKLQVSKNENPTEFIIYSASAEGYATTNNGTNQITRVWGSNFSSSWVGFNIYFLRKKFKVASYIDANNITVTETNGSAVTFSSVETEAFNYSYTTGSGVCNVSGPTVTYVSGDLFVPLFMSDFQFALNGTPETVLSFDSTTQYTLSSSPGDGTNIPFTWRGNVNDQLTTLRVQAIQGANEENINLYSVAGDNFLGRYYTLTTGVAGAYGQHRPIYIGGGVYADNSPKHELGVYPPNSAAGHYGYVSLGGVQGRETLRVFSPNPVTAYNTYLRIDPVSSANAPVGLQAWGAGADVDAFLTGKGAGHVRVGNHKANYLTLYGGDTGQNTVIKSDGSDSNININFDLKGAGEYQFTGSSFTRLMCKIRGTSDSVNYLALNANSTNPTITAEGTGSNYDIDLIPKGTGSVVSTGNIKPSPDNMLTLGTSSARFSITYSTYFRPGNGTAVWTSGLGSPEGAVVAVVGSMYTQLDGGVGSTLYVKEVGSNAFGWTAK